jgi:hypothetical protein
MISAGWSDVLRPGQANANAINQISDQYRVVSIQPVATTDTTILLFGNDLVAVVTHAIDNGKTIRRIPVPEWGAAIQVPAGEVLVGLELANSYPVARTVNVSIAAGNCCVQTTLLSFTVATPPTPLQIFIPPPFAVTQVVRAFAASSPRFEGFYPNPPAIKWIMTLQTANIGTNLLREVPMAAQPLLFRSVIGTSGAFEIEYRCLV